MRGSPGRVLQAISVVRVYEAARAADDDAAIAANDLGALAFAVETNDLGVGGADCRASKQAL